MNFDIDYTKVLYRRNNKYKPTYWYALPTGQGSIMVHHGIVGLSGTREIICTHRKVEDEIKSKINSKRKAGYKYLSEIKDCTSLPVEGNLAYYLETYLPVNRTNANGNLLAMLAKSYDNKNNKLFTNKRDYLGQSKINGLRCFISATKDDYDMFRSIRFRFQSREGIVWKTLGHLESYLLSTLPKYIINKMIDEDYVLDGELYMPGYSVNQINHIVKSPYCKEQALLQFWCYDIAIENTTQIKRIDILNDNLGEYIGKFADKNEHLNNKNRLVILPTVYIDDEKIAITMRDTFIGLGYEGLIMRDAGAEYQYGKRNLSMVKFKAHTDGVFEIVDIKPEGIKRPDVPLFVCKNDINSELFSVHLSGSLNGQEKYIINKTQYIGEKLHIEYGERSGVSQVPFHVKIVKFI